MWPRRLLRRLGLDQVWWIVTPGNPLKSIAELPAQETRMDLVRDLVGARSPHGDHRHRDANRTRYTEETIRFLRSRLPQVTFVWLMGRTISRASIAGRTGKNIAALVPMAIIDRLAPR